MKHKKTTIAIILIAILIIGFLLQNYNSLNNSYEKANNEYSNLSIILDKKIDITKNIINELKVMKYESNTLNKLKKSTEKLENAYNITTKNKYNIQIDDYIEKIEKDIDSKNIKTTEKYNSLIAQLASQNDKIKKAVEKYNKRVNEYNNKLVTIPNNITSKIFGMKPETNYK